MKIKYLGLASLIERLLDDKRVYSIEIERCSGAVEVQVTYIIEGGTLDDE